MSETKGVQRPPNLTTINLVSFTERLDDIVEYLERTGHSTSLDSRFIVPEVPERPVDLRATRLQPLKTKLENEGSIAFKDAMELVEELTHLLTLTEIKGEGESKQPKSMGEDKAAKAQQFKQKFEDQGESSTANKKAKLECVLCPGMTNHATKNCFDYKNLVAAGKTELLAKAMEHVVTNGTKYKIAREPPQQAVGSKPTAKKAIGANNKKGLTPRRRSTRT
ncbi:hypothetical protein BDR26DRAFT_867017 [Obelidium mucronatum]|nr:hypothetical protein BDR26DRAFT_867017 [Obelidium mucronatum]